jgi:hypothetical protein
MQHGRVLCDIAHAPIAIASVLVLWAAAGGCDAVAGGVPSRLFDQGDVLSIARRVSRTSLWRCV